MENPEDIPADPPGQVKKFVPSNGFPNPVDPNPLIFILYYSSLQQPFRWTTYRTIPCLKKAEEDDPSESNASKSPQSNSMLLVTPHAHSLIQLNNTIVIKKIKIDLPLPVATTIYVNNIIIPVHRLLLTVHGNYDEQKIKKIRNKH